LLFRSISYAECLFFIGIGALNQLEAENAVEAIKGGSMKSIAQKCHVSAMMLAALVAPILLAGQEQPESSTSAGAATPNPVPLINQPLEPDAAKPGGEGFTLTINGTEFVSGSVVEWNGSARATTFVSKSQLKASIPASDIAMATTASVTVINPTPGGGTSNVDFFEVTVTTPVIGFLPYSFGAGSGASSVATGDFNKDGKLDLAVVNSASNNISILLGNHNGTFQAHVDYPVGTQPSSVAIGDFNGDGKVDLAVSNENCPSSPCGPGSLSILLGKGDGTFQPAVEYSTGGEAPYSVVVADFNRDGKLDLAVANSGPPTPSRVSVLLARQR
jgi:hypothetical protein